MSEQHIFWGGMIFYFFAMAIWYRIWPKGEIAYSIYNAPHMFIMTGFMWPLIMLFVPFFILYKLWCWIAGVRE